MTTPRRQLIDSEQPLFYHLVSRCVRRSWLCGRDRRSRRDYSHRKQWLIQRIYQLGRAFSIEVHAYAIMSNHFHLVIYYDPKAAGQWSDEEVADRWVIACPAKDRYGEVDSSMNEVLKESLLGDVTKREKARQHLSSVSMFMKHLKQPLARRANLEDRCAGHFFEQRFYSGALLNEAAVVAAMAYVDLNPVRAKIARTLEECKDSSISRRLLALDEVGLDQAVRPLVSGLDEPALLSISLRTYVSQVQSLLNPKQLPLSKQSTWRAQVSLLKKRQRAYGSFELIRDWIQARDMQMREKALI